MLTASERKTIDGALFEKMIAGGVANLRANLQEVNDLNVFPIPDGDTGENMLLTLQGGFDRLHSGENGTLEEKAHAMAQGMLLGARGNSGVILSQLFYGLSEGLTGLEIADLVQFGDALKKGVKCAYGAVTHPVEGTILTVAREAVENACATLTADTSVESFFAGYLREMQKSLEKTPDLLAVLKEAGVIDSGGAGLVYITEGFCKALGGAEVLDEVAVTASQKTIDFSKFTADTVMEYGYCTELLLQLQNAKTDIEAFSIPDLTAFLETIGDSIVAFMTGSIVKIHVHTMTPWKVLAHCQEYGEFLTVKIENMTLQHNETTERKKPKKRRRARRKYAVVTVASGQGLIDTFKEMGVDFVIEGGQTNNPSSEAFIEAFDEVNADHVFVFPNNGNIVMAAKQAAGIYKDSDIRVIESKTIGEGYSALSMLDYGVDDPNEIESALIESMQGVTTGMVSRVARDATVNGVDVQKDGYMGFTNRTMLVSASNKTQAVCALMDALEVKNKEFLIVVYGADTTDADKETVRAYASETCPNVETYEINGGQEIYDYILIVE